MSRWVRLLFGVSATVGVTLFATWLVVQAMIVRPAIGAREEARTQEALLAAKLMASGRSKWDVEEDRGVDLRLLRGQAEGPPPGTGWFRKATHDGVVWKRDGGKYEIAVWNGELWVVLHEDLPYETGLALALVAVGIPIIVLVYGLGQRASRHTTHAEASLARIAEGNLDERLDEATGSREARRVAVSVNRMATQLKLLVEADRQRMAGLSHELRTPLTRIRLELELLRRGGVQVDRLNKVERDIEAFDAMLSDMLALSRLELTGDQAMRLQQVNLRDIVLLVLEQQGLTDVEVRGSGVAVADSKLVALAVGNLLRNSAQHAPSAHRWVDVSDQTLAVGDDGPGISASEHAALVRPFQRGRSSSGHGLGLAIVAQIMALHGGSISLSEPPGLVVSMHFSGTESTI